MNIKYYCPVCGYDLGFPSWNDVSASDEICKSCGIQFGYDDVADGIIEKRLEVYKKWRDKWIINGCKWFSKSKEPEDWNPGKQLANISVNFE